MALAGISVIFAYLSGGGRSDPHRGDASLPYKARSSQNQASPGTLTIAAPGSFDDSPVLASISASAPIFYVVGPAPDITAGPRRYYDPQFGREDIFVDTGDTIAWTAA